MQLPLSICPYVSLSVSMLSFEPSDLWSWPFASVWFITPTQIPTLIPNPKVNPSPNPNANPSAVGMTLILNRGQFSSFVILGYPFHVGRDEVKGVKFITSFTTANIWLWETPPKGGVVGYIYIIIESWLTCLSAISSNGAMYGGEILRADACCLFVTHGLGLVSIFSSNTTPYFCQWPSPYRR